MVANRSQNIGGICSETEKQCEFKLTAEVTSYHNAYSTQSITTAKHGISISDNGGLSTFRTVNCKRMTETIRSRRSPCVNCLPPSTTVKLFIQRQCKFRNDIPDCRKNNTVSCVKKLSPWINAILIKSLMNQPFCKFTI